MVDAPSHGGWALSTQEVTIKKIMLLLAALITGLATLVFPNTASNANTASSANTLVCYGDGIHSCEGWYDSRTSSTIFDAMNWTYPTYELNGLPTGYTGKRIQVIVATSNAASNVVNSNVQRFREYFRRAASVYAASTKRVFTSTGTSGTYLKTQDYTPRFVTKVGGDGKNHVDWKFEQFDASFVESRATDPTQVYQALRQRGYTDPNVVYLVMHLSDCFDPPPSSGRVCVGGYGPNSHSSDPNPATNDLNSGNRFLSVYFPPSANPDSEGMIADMAYTIPHELTHTLGGPPMAAPNYGDSHIVNNGNDLMQYAEYDRASATEQANGNWPCATSKAEMRLDCQNNDYFSVDNPTWQTTRWNMARSDFLWK